MKLILEPVEVLAPEGLPRRITWRGRAFPVDEVQDRWIWRGRWWQKPTLAGETRLYYRVLSHGSEMEIYVSNGAWMLSRIWD